MSFTAPMAFVLKLLNLTKMLNFNSAKSFCFPMHYACIHVEINVGCDVQYMFYDLSDSYLEERLN